MDKRDFVLMVVAAGGNIPLTPVQLQKSLFLVSKNLQGEIPDSFYEFEPYHYGPFDAEVYADADSLESEGLLVSLGSSQGTWLNRATTAAGKERAQKAAEELSASSRDYIQTVVEWTQSLSFSDLVKSIYAHYPEYRKNSVFQG